MVIRRSKKELEMDRMAISNGITYQLLQARRELTVVGVQETSHHLDVRG